MTNRRIPAIGEELMLVHRDGSRPVRVDDVFYTKSAPNSGPIVAVREFDGTLQHFRLYDGPPDYPWERVVQVSTGTGRWVKNHLGVRFV